MMMFSVAVVLGIVLGLIVPYNLTSDTLPYVAVAITAALDSIFGGIVANFNKRFSIYVFMTGLISNAILAVLLTYVGNILGVNLSFAVVIVFGVRIFNNLSNIRRVTIDRYFVRRIKTKGFFRYIGIEGETLSDIEESKEREEKKVSEDSEVKEDKEEVAKEEAEEHKEEK